MVVDPGATSPSHRLDVQFAPFVDDVGVVRVPWSSVCSVHVHAPVSPRWLSLPIWWLALLAPPALPDKRTTTEVSIALRGGSRERWDLGRSPERHSQHHAHELVDELLRLLGEISPPGTSNRLHLLGRPDVALLFAMLDDEPLELVPRILDRWAAATPEGSQG